MPIYEYECQNCGEVIEMRMKMSDPHPEKCPKCEGGPLNKLMSSTAFHLKGGGWYQHAYDGKSNKKPESKSGDDSKSTKSTESSTSSESSKSKSSGDSSTTSKPAKK